jgi:hypothetical protein
MNQTLFFNILTNYNSLILFLDYINTKYDNKTTDNFTSDDKILFNNFVKYFVLNQNVQQTQNDYTKLLSKNSLLTLSEKKNILQNNTNKGLRVILFRT